MNKKELVSLIAKNGSMSSAQADLALEAVTGSIAGSLALGKELRIQGLGTFSVANKKGRKGRNPRTGEEIEIPASRVVRFKPAKGLKEAING
ncbi:HU family DNA-binding protein [Acidithiobacillus thiooxidans]|uniref:DNA-binding protein HU-1 n=1 Tax=Acidithiobacillus thiooxidans ATCC 19377 TaxID=637390 RepID=A0A543Q6N7_ACITH|nr:HU family DNA-binding protein [Acidithiobacillus thiooxidans]MBU2840546.1 HU family DNA-binding protein [Acidithiobacillus thiooxidans]MDD2750682.1 HU family DNA-binding protein [Acidithiobacillus sp.]MDX5933794.1 HU family DNA-binding protein [Acidithiobacillus thiooxidans]TQN51988.1 DNA-binding protein HU-1 [Acidithiobacillus thiooxidans ATCC 19377]